MALTRPNVIVKPFADSGDKNVIPLDSLIGITPGAPSLETGFPPLTSVDPNLGGVPVKRADFNGIFNLITQHSRFTNAGGQPVFDEDLCTEIGGYPVGVVLQDDAGANSYINILAANTTNFNTAPSSIGVSWVPFSTEQPGSIIFLARNTSPVGYLKANGAAISRVTYARLFAAIGTTFGAGNGSTTFNIPDMRGEFPRCWDDGRGVDASRAFGSAQLDSMQGHHHSQLYNTSGGSATINRLDSTVANTGGPAASVMVGTYAGHPSPDGVNGTPRVGNESRPRNVALLACIKY